MEGNTLYAEKFENYQKAMNRQEGSHVPNAFCNAGGSLFWNGKTVFDVAGNPPAYAEAITAVLKEMWVDVNLMCAVTATPRMGEAFPTIENKITSDGTLMHLQNSPMKVEEYDQLIADPKAFVSNVLLPRKYPYLYESREKTKELLKVYAEEQVGNLVIQMGYTDRYLAEVYGVPSAVNFGCMLNTPLDHLFDFFRGFRGTLTDLRRCPDKVQAAIDAIWEYRCAPLVATPYDASKGFPFQPCHIPSYLSPELFKKLYWPYEKKLIEWVAAGGSKIMLCMEGKWEKVMSCFTEVPRDSVVLSVDDDDFLKTHEVLGDYQILVGGMRAADLRYKTVDDLKDSIKCLIDTCGPGGAYLFGVNKVLLARGDVNQTLIDCYNFAHEYSTK